LILEEKVHGKSLGIISSLLLILTRNNTKRATLDALIT